MPTVSFKENKVIFSSNLNEFFNPEAEFLSGRKHHPALFTVVYTLRSKS